MKIAANKENHEFHILIADSSTVDLFLMEWILRRAGYNQLLLADNGFHALSLLKSNPIDLLITELDMPYLSGIGLSLELRNQPDYNSLPIIMVSSDQDKDSIREAKECGVSHFVSKPINQECFLTGLSAYI
ncbi:MAG: response regulator [SAR324 cluster bacterium]|nr:response regulator [SAR324 cluster bacterium]